MRVKREREKRRWKREDGREKMGEKRGMRRERGEEGEEKKGDYGAGRGVVRRWYQEVRRKKMKG